MSKSKSQYDKLFEDLMRYTSFRSVDEIKTKEDLRAFFNEVQEDSDSKGLTFNVSSKMKFEMDESRRRIIRSGKLVSSTRKPFTRSEEVIKSDKKFRSYKDAKSRNLIVKNEKGKLVFKSQVTVKGKRKIVYRDEKGRFASSPILSIRGEYT